MLNKDVIVITAPSGAGKSTIINALMMRHPDSFIFSISHTTRYKRESEIDGKDYYFIDDKKFKTMIENDEFLEWAKVGDFFYGTSYMEIEKAKQQKKKLIFDIDVQGFLNIKDKGIDFLSVFIKVKCIEELEKRLTTRGLDSQEQIKKRIERAKKEIEYEKMFDHVIMNYDLDECIREVERLFL